MPFQKKRAYAGSVIENYESHSLKFPSPKSRPAQRASKQNETPDKQKEINERLAKDKLRLLILANFKPNDYYLTLTYAGIEPTPDEAKKILETFRRRLKYHYEKKGAILKYIIITECKGTRIHHHMLINKAFELDIQTIEKIWNQGEVHKETYRGKPYDAVRIANYFIKKKHSAFYKDNKVFARRWYPSQNLKKPKIETTTVSLSTWRKTIRIPKGYYMEKESFREGFTLFGYPYRFYRFVKIEEERKCQKKTNVPTAPATMRRQKAK